MSPDPILEETIDEIVTSMNLVPTSRRESYLMSSLWIILNPAPDLWIYGTIAYLNSEFAGHAREPILISTLEMLEGMIALRRILA